MGALSGRGYAAAMVEPAAVGADRSTTPDDAVAPVNALFNAVDQLAAIVARSRSRGIGTGASARAVPVAAQDDGETDRAKPRRRGRDAPVGVRSRTTMRRLAVRARSQPLIV